MYLNGFRLADATRIRVGLDNNDPNAYVYADVNGSPQQIGAYLQADAANLASALSSFIAQTGYPWISVGDLSSMSWANGTHGILAANLDHTGFSMSDTGTGINFYGGSGSYATFGYEPWADFASAQAAIRQLQGNITWSPSS